MTSEQLIAEGRRLMRPSVFLRPAGSGAVAAIFHARGDNEIETAGHRLWLTIDASYIPGVPKSVTGYLSIFTEEKKGLGGRIEVAPSWPKRTGVELFAHPVSVLPPIDAVFARGSDAVGAWIRSNGWERTERYNDNFKERETVQEYEKIWMREFPLFADSDIYAVLGGWHWPGADDDWHDLLDEHLMLMTFRDSEPWVEAWLTRKGQFKVIQRIT